MTWCSATRPRPSHKPRSASSTTLCAAISTANSCASTSNEAHTQPQRFNKSPGPRHHLRRHFARCDSTPGDLTNHCSVSSARLLQPSRNIFAVVPAAPEAPRRAACVRSPSEVMDCPPSKSRRTSARSSPAQSPIPNLEDDVPSPVQLPQCALRAPPSPLTLLPPHRALTEADLQCVTWRLSGMKASSPASSIAHSPLDAAQHAGGDDSVGEDGQPMCLKRKNRCAAARHAPTVPAGRGRRVNTPC